MQSAPAASMSECRRILLDLGFPPNRAGYRQLYVAIEKYASDPEQGMLSEVYPYVAKVLGRSDGRSVEITIRRVIQDTWKARNKQKWKQYFPYHKTAPTNKQFIATIVEYL